MHLSFSDVLFSLYQSAILKDLLLIFSFVALWAMRYLNFSVVTAIIFFVCSYILEKLPQAAKYSIYSLVFVWTKLHSSIRSFQLSLSLMCAVFHLIIYLDDMSVGKKCVS